MQNLDNSKSIHNVLRSQLPLLPISSTQQRPRHQTSSRKRNRKAGAANAVATKREQQATGDLPTSPPAGSAETDWICCGAPLGDLSHGRGAIDWQMKQEKKKSERERETRGSSALHLQAWWSPEVGDVDEASNTPSVSIYSHNRFQDRRCAHRNRYCTQSRYMLLCRF
jgi:hypothetical protein